MSGICKIRLLSREIKRRPIQEPIDYGRIVDEFVCSDR